MAERDWRERGSLPTPRALCLRKAGGRTEPGLVWDVLGWRCLENVMWLAVSLETDGKVYRFADGFPRQSRHQC